MYSATPKLCVEQRQMLPSYSNDAEI